MAWVGYYVGLTRCGESLGGSIMEMFGMTFGKRWIRKLMGSRIYRRLNLNWHREDVGGMWEKIGRLQFDFLVTQGLRTDHHFLDVACGSLRGGIHFIRYLEAGHYFGVDKNKELLDAGRKIELKRHNLIHKNPTLLRMDNFEFLSLNQKFEYGLALSLFTHLPLNNIIRCIMNVKKVLVPGGRFYASFFEKPNRKVNLDSGMHLCTHDSAIITYRDKDPYHYDFETFKHVCEGSSLEVKYIGAWNHPRNQKMMAFVKTS